MSEFTAPRWIPLDERTLDPDPFVQFERWWEEAVAVVREPEAICLATADASGQPRARMVLLRGRDERGFCVYTNYLSRKGEDLAENPRASLLWYVEPLGRQVRIEGRVEQVAPDESDAYFAERPRGHQVGAHASQQSRPIVDRAALEAAVAAEEERFAGGDVPRPAHWGGYRVVPTCFEFWQHREDRIHDRVLYTPADGGGWERRRHQP
jgi:pyridoxamine 5'-phosphate oxidase